MLKHRRDKATNAALRQWENSWPSPSQARRYFQRIRDGDLRQLLANAPSASKEVRK